jgi:hypothetical protein
MALRTDDRNLRIAILVVAVIAFGSGAAIYAADWKACNEYRGGIACREPRNMAAGAFGALGLTMLTLITNTKS